MLEAVTRGRQEAPIYRSCHRRNSGPQPTLLLKWEPVNSSRSGASPAGSTGGITRAGLRRHQHHVVLHHRPHIYVGIAGVVEGEAKVRLFFGHQSVDHIRWIAFDIQGKAME